MIDFNPGDVINDQYRVSRLLGEGGMNRVYLVQDTERRRYYALKVTRGQEEMQSSKAEIYNQFLNEVSLLTTMRHESLPEVKDYFALDDQHYILIEEYVDGMSLEEFNRRSVPTEEQVTGWAIIICEALEYLHENGIIYRDLKPKNVMLTKSGRLKLIDFDICRVYKEGRTADTVSLGTPGYAAPETYGKAQSDARSDIYSLGALMHQLLSGADPQKKPFQFGKLCELRLGIHEELEKIVEKALQMKATDRYRSASEMRAELTRVIHILCSRAASEAAALTSPSAFPLLPFRAVPLAPLHIDPALLHLGTLERLALRLSNLRLRIEIHIHEDEAILGRSMLRHPVVKFTGMRKGNNVMAVEYHPVFPDTCLCYPRKMTDPQVTVHSTGRDINSGTPDEQRWERALLEPHSPIKLTFSFALHVQPERDEQAREHELYFYFGLPCFPDYIFGDTGIFEIIPGELLEYRLRTPASFSGNSNRISIIATHDNTIVEGTILWLPAPEFTRLTYSPISNWKGPRFILNLRQKHYSWIYTKGFGICSLRK